MTSLLLMMLLATVMEAPVRTFFGIVVEPGE